MDTEVESEVNSPRSSRSPASQFPQTLLRTPSWVVFVSLYCSSFKSSLGSCISKHQALQILDPCGLKSEGSTHGIRGNKELEESSYCPQRTRRVSRGGRRDRRPAVRMLQGHQRAEGLRMGHWTWPCKKKKWLILKCTLSTLWGRGLAEQEVSVDASSGKVNMKEEDAVSAPLCYSVV